MSALFEVTYSIQSISLLILAPNEKKKMSLKVFSLSPAQLGIFNRPRGIYGDSGDLSPLSFDICAYINSKSNQGGRLLTHNPFIWCS